MKRHYRMGQFKTASQPEVERRVKDDDEVLFWGDTLSAILSIEEDINQALLELSLSLYVPFRGFTFTSCWMEQYNSSNNRASAPGSITDVRLGGSSGATEVITARSWKIGQTYYRDSKAVPPPGPCSIIVSKLEPWFC